MIDQQNHSKKIKIKIMDIIKKFNWEDLKSASMPIRGVLKRGLMISKKRLFNRARQQRELTDFYQRERAIINKRV